MAASAPEDEKAEVPDDLEAAPEDAPLELENPPGEAGVLWAGAEGCADCVGAGLLVDQPDELPDGAEGEDGAGAGLLG